MFLRYAICIVLCLTVGLTPYVPEPIVVGKVRWVLRGAVGMDRHDWYQLLLHGGPFLALGVMIIFDLIRSDRR